MCLLAVRMRSARSVRSDRSETGCVCCVCVVRMPVCVFVCQ